MTVPFSLKDSTNINNVEYITTRKTRTWFCVSFNKFTHGIKAYEIVEHIIVKLQFSLEFGSVYPSIILHMKSNHMES